MLEGHSSIASADHGERHGEVGLETEIEFYIVYKELVPD